MLAVDRRPELLQQHGLFHGDAAGGNDSQNPKPGLRPGFGVA